MRKLWPLCLLLTGCLANSPFDDSVTETNPRLFWSVSEVSLALGIMLTVAVVAVLLSTRE